MPAETKGLPRDLVMPSKKILDELKQAKRKGKMGYNISELVRATHLSRYTAVKVLSILEDKNLIKGEKMATAKVYRS